MRGKTHLLLIVLLVLTAARFAHADWTTENEHWYAMELGGARVGWMHIIEEREGETYRTTTTTKVTINRAGASITAVIMSAFFEAADGRPIRLEYSQDMSTQAITSTITFEGDAIVLTSKQGENQTEKRLPAFEEVWLTPRQISERFRAALESGEETIEYHGLDGSAGAKLVDVRHVRLGEDTMTIDGEDQPITIWKTTSSLIPTPATERYDARGVLVAQEINMGFGLMKTLRSSREEAMSAGDGKTPELLVASFVKPDKPLKHLSRIARLELRLSSKEGELKEFPSAGAQRVSMEEGGTSAIVTIDVDREGDEWSEEKPADLSEFLEPSITINSDDAKVLELAERAVQDADADDTLAKAEALRRLADRHISRKGLEVAFASAAETVRTKQGDCSEHAVLLCAMLRAQQIPARVVTGLLYVDEFAGQRDAFGWHMWTQAWIDDRWVDLDATLPGKFHAGHIATGASSLADGIVDAEFTDLVLLMGRLDIDVVAVQYAERGEPTGAAR